MNFGISIGPVTREPDGRLSQTWHHKKFGGGTWLLDPDSLRALGKVRNAGPCRPNFGKIEGKFPD